MNRLLGLIVFSVVAIGAWADEPPTPPDRIESVEVIRCPNLSYGEAESHPKFVICETVLDREPPWVPTESTAPPLSIADAVRITRAEIPRYDAADLKWSVREVVLREVFAQRWVYLVRWKAFDAQEFKEHTLLIPVLMSGRTIAGETRNQQDEEQAR